MQQCNPPRLTLVTIRIGPGLDEFITMSSQRGYKTNNVLKRQMNDQNFKFSDGCPGDP
jgi:hypothetical protein